MPAAQFWRLTGIEVYEFGAPLELSALHLCGAGGRLDAAATLTSSHAPESGALASLQDDDSGTSCSFSAPDIQAPGFVLHWDFGAGNTASVWGLCLGAGAAIGSFLARATLEYWAGSAWASAPLGRYAWPGSFAMTAPPSSPVVFGRAPGAMEHSTSGVRYWNAKAISADGQTIFAVVVGGYIYKSSNGGEAWAALVSAGSRSWLAIAVSDDGARVFACDYGGYIYGSENGGATWTALTGAGSRPWQSIASSADGQRIAASGNGTYIYTSADGGATWTARTGAPTKAWRLACSADGLTILACPSNGGFPHTSIDGGATWTERSPGMVSGEWSQSAVSSDGLRMAACRNGSSIYTSADGGATWTARTGGGAAAWVGMGMSGDGMRLVAGGQPGLLTTSIDGGVSWTFESDFGSRYWTPLAVSRSGAMAVIAYEPSSVFTILFPNSDFLAPLLRAKKREMFPAVQMEYAQFQVQLASGLVAARDVEHGGTGTIYGTTKTKGTPNTSTQARVVLLHQRSKLPVREAWSDPVTGYFEFRGIDTAQQFIVLAEDADGNFRPVAANRLTPEVLP